MWCPGDASKREAVNPAKPLISVCIPMYNNLAYHERCLRSILQEGGGSRSWSLTTTRATTAPQSPPNNAATGPLLLRNEPLAPRRQQKPQQMSGSRAADLSVHYMVLLPGPANTQPTF